MNIDLTMDHSSGVVKCFKKVRFRKVVKIYPGH